MHLLVPDRFEEQMRSIVYDAVVSGVSSIAQLIMQSVIVSVMDNLRRNM